MDNYLNQLPLTAEDKEKLRGLAASTPAALLSLIRASHDSFSRFFGPQRTQQLIAWLQPLLSEEERQRLTQPAKRYPIQGVRFTESPAPVLPRPDFDIEERDRLFARLSALRSQHNPPPEVQREIASLEERLSTILR